MNVNSASPHRHMHAATKRSPSVELQADNAVKEFLQFDDSRAASGAARRHDGVITGPTC
jgi:hypothetical protein